MKVITITIIALILGSIFFIGYSIIDSKEEHKFIEEPQVYCGEYGYISYTLFINSAYCKSLYGIE